MEFVDKQSVNEKDLVQMRYLHFVLRTNIAKYLTP